MQAEQKVKDRQKKVKLLERFESDNDAFEKKHKKSIDCVYSNRRAVKGYLGEDDTKVTTNIILSNLTTYWPYIFAKSPEIAVIPREKVQPVDGDTNEDGEKQGPTYEQARKFGDTARLVVQTVMKRANIKKHAKKAVKAATISKIAFAKISFRKDTVNDPTVVSELQTAQHDLLKLKSIQSKLQESGEDVSDSGECSENQAEIDKAQNIIKGLQQRVRKLDPRGVNMSVIPIEQMRWDITKPIDDIREGSFIAHYVYAPMKDVMSKYSIKDSKQDDSRPVMWKKFSGLSQKDDDKNSTTLKNEEKKHVRVWERWDAETNSIYLWVEGDNDYLVDAKPVKMMEEIFYPFFPLALNTTEGEEFPESMVDLLIPLAEQYEKDTLDKREHRKAAIPFTIADAGKIDGKKLKPQVEKAGVREILLVDTNGAPLNTMFHPGPSVPINPTLYDRTDNLFDIQQTTGLQDAQRGAITKAKTLGEAEIAQDALASRNEDDRDQVEDWLRDIYRYVLMLLLQEMTSEEVIEIAGEHAYWPQFDDSQKSYFSLVDVNIEAGSTGRPNKGQERKVWLENLELLMTVVERITAMRKDGIIDAKNPYYRILEETFRRLDERIDIETILPEGEVITVSDLIQSVMQQVDELSQQNAEMGQMAAQFLQSNPIVNQKLQEMQQQQNRA